MKHKKDGFFVVFFLNQDGSSWFGCSKFFAIICSLLSLMMIMMMIMMIMTTMMMDSGHASGHGC